MYLHHIIGFSSKALIIFSSKSVINKIAYRDANFVPIAVPRTYLKVFHQIQKCCFLALFQRVLYIRVSLEIGLLSLNSKNLRREVIPSLCGLLR